MPAWPRVHYARVEATPAAAAPDDGDEEGRCDWRPLLFILCFCLVAAAAVTVLLIVLPSRNSDDHHQPHHHSEAASTTTTATQWCDIIDCCKQWSSSSSSSSSWQWQPEKRCLEIKSKASWNATCHIHKPEGRICCKAMLASCLACPYGGDGNTITVADYCRCKPATAGCKP